MVARILSQAEQRQIDQFWSRRASALKRAAADDAQRVPGMPYYHRCESCHALMAISTSELPGAPPNCEDCRYLIDHGLMPPEGSQQ